MMRKFLKNLFLLVIGITALILIVAEGDNKTAFIKLAACALIAAGLLLHAEWNEDESFNKKKGESHGA